MIANEPTESFLARLTGVPTSLDNPGTARSNVILFRLDDLPNANASYNRRDFYKVSLIFSPTRIGYANRQIDILQPALVFFNPYVPYSWEQLTNEQRGFCYLFQPSFFTNSDRSHFRDSPLFRIGETPVFLLETHQIAYITSLFERMWAELATDYVHREDVLKNLISLVLHEALKWQPASEQLMQKSALTRIAELFMELLNRQFPVDLAEHVLRLKTPGDYAHNLSIHVNHLNQAIKATTGQTTSAHISERILNEARVLLLHSDLNVADVAYSLGFEDPSSFNKFFKKGLGESPTAFRHHSLRQVR